MIVYVSGISVYRCRLTDEEEQKVKQYAEENDTTFETAVSILYDREEINLYYDCEESDYYIEKIEQVFD